MSALNNWCILIITDINRDTMTCFSIDCEWNYKDGTDEIMRLLQLSFLSEKVAVIYLRKIGIFDTESFPVILKHLLEI